MVDPTWNLTFDKPLLVQMCRGARVMRLIYCAALNLFTGDRDGGAGEERAAMEQGRGTEGG